jgi:predicted NACHT family NTPase
VNLLNKISSWQWRTDEELRVWEEKFINRISFGEIVGEGIDGLNLAKDKKHIMILGQPGAGKTTFLKYLALAACQGKFPFKVVPVFISLKDVSESDKSLLNCIATEFDTCDFPNAQKFIEHQLLDGKMLILLDGLDEVSRINQTKIHDEVNRFCDKFSRNRFVISCRTAAYNQNFPRFVDAEVSEFDEPQMKSFIRNWFTNNEPKSVACWRKITEPDNKPILELAKNPLLLTLLCIAFDDNLEFPTNRAELYGDAIEALLRKWLSSKNIAQEQIYHALSTTRKKQMLSYIAYDAFDKERFFLKQELLERQISDYLQNLPRKHGETETPCGCDVLKTIEAQHGLLVERTHNVYSFSHLTFQEYFAARFIVESSAKAIISQVLTKHLADIRWREVFLLCAETLPEADDFFLMMSRCANKSQLTGSLKEYLAWINDVVSDQAIKTKRSQAEMRAYYIFLSSLIGLIPTPASNLQNITARALALASSITSQTVKRNVREDNKSEHIVNADRATICDLVYVLSCATGNNVEHYLEEFRRRLMKLDSADAIQSKEINDQLITMVRVINNDLKEGRRFALDKNDIELLSGYLYVNNLILDCLNCQTYLTSEIRSQIIDKVLNPTL